MTDNCIFILMYIWKRQLLQVFLNENICSVIISCFKLNNVFLNHIIPLRMSDWSCHIQLSGLILRDEHIHSNHFFGKTVKNTMFILTSHVTNEKKKKRKISRHKFSFTLLYTIPSNEGYFCLLSKLALSQVKRVSCYFGVWALDKWQEWPLQFAPIKIT